jgi:hypothetical protein
MLDQHDGRFQLRRIATLFAGWHEHPFVRGLSRGGQLLRARLCGNDYYCAGTRLAADVGNRFDRNCTDGTTQTSELALAAARRALRESQRLWQQDAAHSGGVLLFLTLPLEPAGDCPRSVDFVFFRRRGIVLIVKFVFCFQPVFQRVSSVYSSVASMDLVGAPLDFVRRVSVLGLGARFGIAQGEGGWEAIAAYDLIHFLHSGPSFCTAQPVFWLHPLDEQCGSAVAELWVGLLGIIFIIKGEGRKDNAIR